MIKGQLTTRKNENKLLLIAFVVLLLICTGFFASAIHFGLIWDDPEWYARGIGKAVGALIKPSPDYQFYRPGLMIYNHLFVRSDETLAISLLHWAQICWYLINLTIIFSISRRVGFTLGAAFMAAVLTASHAFVYQSVAWAAPGQPLTAVLANLSLLLYLVGRKHQSTVSNHSVLLILSLALFVAAISVHEGSVAFAIMPFLFEASYRLQHKTWSEVLKSLRHLREEGWIEASLYLLIAFLFWVIWLIVPKESGITDIAWDPRVFIYLLQGFVSPFADARLTTFFTQDFTLGALWLSFILLLWSIAVYRKRGTLASLGLIWAFLGIAPILISLPYSYVSIGSRLFYSSIPGIAWIWVCSLWPPAKNHHSITAVFGITVLLFVTLFGLITNWNIKQLYTEGITLLNEMSLSLSDKTGDYLFINFPDRYRLKEEPFARGYWGITLAPVVVDLAEFPALLNGSVVQTESRSMPWIDETNRTNSPYAVDMRGVIIQPDELAQLAKEKEGVFVTRYQPTGKMDLYFAGSLQEWAGESCETAVFDNTICLHSAKLIPVNDELILRTVWWTKESLPPHLTLFTHLQRPGAPLIQADGDTWQGTLPLANWQPGTLIIDERRLPLPPDNSPWSISIGIYNWVNGERLTGIDAKNQPLLNNIYIVESNF